MIVLVCLLRFSILCFCFSLHNFVLALFAFVALGSVSSLLCTKRLAGKNVFEMTHFMLSGT